MKRERTNADAALRLTGVISANPAIAPSLLRILKEAGEDPEKLDSLVNDALKDVKDAIPEAPTKAFTVDTTPQGGPDYVDFIPRPAPPETWGPS